MENNNGYYNDQNQQGGYYQQNQQGGYYQQGQQGYYQQQSGYTANGQGYNGGQQYNQQGGYYQQDQRQQSQDAYFDQFAAQQTAMQGMNQGFYQQSGSAVLTGAAAEERTRAVLTRSFGFMFIALMLTGIVALATISSSGMYEIFWGTGSAVPLLIVMIANFALVIACQSAMTKDNVAVSAVLFGLFVITNGIMMSVIFLAFQLSSIATIFFMTGVIFGVMAAIGALTKIDLTSMGSVLFVGLIGILIASIVNIFIGSSIVDTVVCILGIVIFIGYTVYDTAKIKQMAVAYTSMSVTTLGMLGAMTLYLDFENLFLKLLQLFGKRK